MNKHYFMCDLIKGPVAAFIGSTMFLFLNRESGNLLGGGGGTLLTQTIL